MKRRVAIALLGALLVIGLYALAQVSIRRLDFFRIRMVEVVGNRHLDERELVHRLAIPVDAHIGIALEPIAERARTIAGVRQARVERRWPGDRKSVV